MAPMKKSGGTVEAWLLLGLVWCGEEGNVVYMPCGGGRDGVEVLLSSPDASDMM